MILGGISVASAPEAQISPIDIFLSYPSLRSWGKATSPSITISPPITPDIAANTTATAIVCIATPPRSFPAKIDIASNKSSATPALSKIDAIKTNKGTAIKGYFSSNPKAFVETRYKPPYPK